MKLLSKIPVEKIIFLLVVLASVYVVFSPVDSLMNWYSQDDAFYYFKTAQNLTEGYGLSFDRIGLSSGFHPLWMLVCIPIFALARFDLILPLRILALVSILLTAGSSVLIYRLLKDRLSPFISLFFSLLWGFSRPIFAMTAVSGMESGISAFFVIFLLYLVVQYREKNTGKLWQIGIVATLAILSRLDNIFLAAFIGIWLLFKPGWLRSLVIFDILAAVISAFLGAFIRLGFGDLYAQYLDATKVMVVLAPILHLITFYILGLYGTSKPYPIWKEFLRILAAVSIVSIILFGSMFVLQTTHVLNGFPRTVIIWEWVFSLVFTILIRSGYLALSKSKHFLPLHTDESKLGLQWRTWLRDGFWYALPIGSTLAVYMGFNRIYFGVWTPVSGQIKHWWGTLITVYGRPIDSIPAFFGISNTLLSGPWKLLLWFQNAFVDDIYFWFNITNRNNFNLIIYLLSIPGLLIACYLLIRYWKNISANVERFAVLPLFAGCLIQIVQYTGTRYVNMRTWYWVTEAVLSIILTAILAGAFQEIFNKWFRNIKFQKAVEIFLVSVLIINFEINIISLVPPFIVESQRGVYIHDIHELEAATQPGDIIGSTGGGSIAYFIQDRTIVNLDGLMNSVEYYNLSQEFHQNEYFAEIGMQYVYASYNIITLSEPYVIIFENHVEPVGLIGETTLFRYTP